MKSQESGTIKEANQLASYRQGRAGWRYPTPSLIAGSPRTSLLVYDRLNKYLPFTPLYARARLLLDTSSDLHVDDE